MKRNGRLRGDSQMLRNRLLAGLAVLPAVAPRAVGGGVSGVPGRSAAQPFPANGMTTAADGTNRAPHAVRDLGILDAAAKALNLTTDQLREKLSDGKTTIADVAKQQ